MQFCLGSRKDNAGSMHSAERMMAGGLFARSAARLPLATHSVAAPPTSSYWVYVSTDVGPQPCGMARWTSEPTAQ